MVWVGLLLIVLGIWPALSPRSMWRVQDAWKYRHPEANEPSDLAYAISRGLGIAMVVIGIGMVATAVADRATADPCDSIEAAFSDTFLPGIPAPREGLGESLTTFAADRDARIVDADGSSPTLVATDRSWQMAVEVTRVGESLSTLEGTCVSPAP